MKPDPKATEALKREIVEDARAGGHLPGDWYDDGYTSIACDRCGCAASIDDAGNCVWDNLQNTCNGAA